MEERLTVVDRGLSIKLVVGIFFAILGIVLTLGNFRLIDADQILRFWPIVFVAVGLAKVADPMSRGFAVVMIGLGVLLIALNTRLVHVHLRDLWPLLLIVAGLIVVAQALGWRAGGEAGGSARNVWSVLNHSRIAVDSRDFTGGRIVAVLGACEMDLTKADIRQSPAVINVLVLMGGIELRVPDGWEVVGEAVPFMGGVDMKTRSKRTGRQLIVRGFVMMGGIDVKDVAARVQ
jgi:hypothetical protein